VQQLKQFSAARGMLSSVSKLERGSDGGYELRNLL
jgi:hypothetical protein